MTQSDYWQPPEAERRIAVLTENQAWLIAFTVIVFHALTILYLIACRLIDRIKPNPPTKEM
jgi:hypothetical protein